MKSHLFLLLAVMVLAQTAQAQLHNNFEQPVSINNTGNPPDASAILDVASNKQGVLTPRMTSLDRMAITNPATGLLVFDTDWGKYAFYNGTNWVDISDDDDWGLAFGGGIYHDGSGVSIGSPVNYLDIELYVQQSGMGAGSSGITAYRAGTTTASNGGTAWTSGNVSAAIEGMSIYGNYYSAAVYGSSGLNYTNSAAVLGTNSTGDIYGALGYNNGSSTLAGYFNGDVRFNDARVGINTSPSDNYGLHVYKTSSNTGAGTAAIYGRRTASNASSDGGTGWGRNEVDAGVKGFSIWGNNYTAAVYGSSDFFYENSGAVVGADFGGDVFGALGFYDGDNDVWAGYFDGQVRIKQQVSGRGISFENHNDAQYWRLGISSATENLYFYFNGTLMSSIRDSDGAYIVNSDRSLKTNIEYLEGVLPKVMALKPAKYNYKSSIDAAQKSHGFIAQEVQEIFPEIVDRTEEGTLALAYDDFAILAIKSIQEQQGIIEEQNAKITSQDEKIENLQNQLNKIKAMLENE